MIGGLVSGLGMFLASFATSLMHLYLSIGLLSGLGWAMVFTPSIASVARYFKKRRSLATGLAFTGVGLSSFAFSPLFQYLVDIFAWRGALVILSGMTFNLLVCGALIRPLTLKEDLLASEKVAVEQSKDRNCLGQCFSLFDLSLLSHRPFMRFVLAITLINTGYFVPYVHLVAHARGKNFDEYRAAFLMSVAAAADLCGRIFSGWMADLGRFQILHILVFWTSLTGLSLALVPLGQSYTTLLAISTGYGFCAGAMTPLVFSLLPEIVGIGHIFGALGLLQMLESIGGLLGAPLSGWLRDLTGSYTTSFCVAGGFFLLGSLVLCTLPNCFSCCSAKPLDQLAVVPEELKVDPASDLLNHEVTVH
nr:monocarboxylate transporter 13 isoform X2 [Geotrypetes seraphini]